MNVQWYCIQDRLLELSDELEATGPKDVHDVGIDEKIEVVVEFENSVRRSTEVSQ